jgi:hypothetical protein
LPPGIKQKSLSSNVKKKFYVLYITKKTVTLLYIEIADMLGISVKTINIYIAKALGLISEALKNNLKKIICE